MIFYPGSFKPPHKGHFNNLKYLLKKYKNENILIIISKKERPTNPDFYQLEKQKSDYIKDLCIKYKINYTTKVDSINIEELLFKKRNMFQIRNQKDYGKYILINY